MGILTRSGCPKPEVLFAYEDGALDPDEQTTVAAHLRVCDRCYERLALSHEIRVLVRRSAPPLVDDPEGLKELKQRLREPHPPPPTVRQHVHSDRRVVLGVVLLMLLGVGLISTQTIEGGSSFTRWFSDDAPFRRNLPEGPVGGTPLVAPSVVIGEPMLPFGLVPTESEPDSAGARYYRNTKGLTIAVIIEQDEQSQLYSDSGASTTEIIGVNGREVYVPVNDTPVGPAVVAFDWIESGQLVSVLVVERPTAGLSVDAAQEIADALISLERD